MTIEPKKTKTGLNVLNSTAEPELEEELQLKKNNWTDLNAFFQTQAAHLPLAQWFR